MILVAFHFCIVKDNSIVSSLLLKTSSQKQMPIVFSSQDCSRKLTILFTLVFGLHLLKFLFHMMGNSLYLSLVWLEENLHGRETLFYFRHQEHSVYWRNKNFMFICRMMIFKLMGRTMSSRKWSCPSGDTILTPTDLEGTNYLKDSSISVFLKYNNVEWLHECFHLCQKNHQNVD